MGDPIVWCHYCGRRWGIEKDHVIPRRFGGPRHDWNLVPACVPCNRAKGCMSYEDFTGRSLPVSCVRAGWVSTDQWRASQRALAAERRRARRVAARVASGMTEAEASREAAFLAAWVPPEPPTAVLRPPGPVWVDHPAWVDPRP